MRTSLPVFHAWLAAVCILAQKQKTWSWILDLDWDQNYIFVVTLQSSEEGCLSISEWIITYSLKAVLHLYIYLGLKATVSSTQR